MQIHSMPVFLERDVADDSLAPVKLDDSGKDEMVALLTAESREGGLDDLQLRGRPPGEQLEPVDPTDATLIEPLDA